MSVTETPGVKFELQHQSIRIEAFLRCSVVKSSAGPGIELDGNHVAVVLREGGHIDAFGYVLTDEAVGVFVGSAFPGMMWSGEVEL